MNMPTIQEIPREYHPQTVIEKRALATVKEVHSGQIRDGVVPERYIDYLADIALLLQKAGEKPATVAAGLLCATPEGTANKYTLANMRREFGHDIANMVAATRLNPLIEDPAKREKLRLDTIQDTPNIGALAIFAAADSSDLTLLLAYYKRFENTPLDDIHTGKLEQLLKYQLLLAGLADRIPKHSIIPHFGKQVIQLERIVNNVT